MSKLSEKYYHYNVMCANCEKNNEIWIEKGLKVSEALSTEKFYRAALDSYMGMPVKTGYIEQPVCHNCGMSLIGNIELYERKTVPFRGK